MCKSSNIYSFGVSGVLSLALLALLGFGVGMKAEGLSCWRGGGFPSLSPGPYKQKEQAGADPPAVGSTVTAWLVMPGARQLAGSGGQMLLGWILLQPKRAGREAVKVVLLSNL